MEEKLERCERSYLDFVEACQTASTSCTKAACVCAQKANEAGRKRSTSLIGGTATGIAVGTAAVGLTAATGGLGGIVLGAVAGTAGVATAAGVTYSIASQCTRIEDSFRSLQGDFDSLLKFAHDLEEEMAQVRTILQNVATQIDSITYCITESSSVKLVQDALIRLNDASREASVTTSKCKEDVEGKIQELREHSLVNTEKNL